VVDDPDISAGHQRKEEESGDYNRLIPVAWAILVMGISRCFNTFVCFNWLYRTYLLMRLGPTFYPL
jgi:hypothetical protein